MWWWKKLSSIALCAPIILMGQRIDLLKQIEAKYPQEKQIYLYKKDKFKIYLKDNKPKVEVEEYVENIILSDLLNLDDKEEVYYSSFHNLTDYEAYTKALVGEKYKEYKVKNITTKSDMDQDVFNNDVKIKTFVFPEIRKGSIKCLRKVFDLEYAEFINKTILNSNIPIDKYEIELEIDPRIHCQIFEHNLGSYPYQYKETIEKNKIIKNWIFDTVAKYKQEPRSGHYLSFNPHFTYLIKDYVLDGDTIQVLNNRNQLFKFVRQFVANLDTNYSASLIAKSKELAASQPNEFEQVKNIYYWVKKNIKYIAFEAGLEGFVPRNANDVYDKRYGDCKDMANLIASMCHIAGIKTVYKSWIGTDKIPYKIDSFPSPSCFNHMISIYRPSEDEYHVLDATDPFVSISAPSSFTQGKEAFLYKNQEDFEILYLEPTPSSQNRRDLQVNIELKDDSLFGHGNIRISGYQRIHFMDRMYGLNEEQKKQFLQNYIELGNNKFKYRNYVEKNVEIIDSPIVIDFDFNVQNYIKKAKDEIYVNLFLEKMSDYEDLKPNRKSNIESSFKTKLNVMVNLKIPDGYLVNYVPESTVFETPYQRFEVQYQKTANQIRCYYNMDNNYIEMPKEDYKIINNFQQKIMDASLETISLKTKNN